MTHVPMAYDVGNEWLSGDVEHMRSRLTTEGYKVLNWLTLFRMLPMAKLVYPHLWSPQCLSSGLLCVASQRSTVQPPPILRTLHSTINAFVTFMPGQRTQI